MDRVRAMPGFHFDVHQVPLAHPDQGRRKGFATRRLDRVFEPPIRHADAIGEDLGSVREDFSLEINFRPFPIRRLNGIDIGNLAAEQRICRHIRASQGFVQTHDAATLIARAGDAGAN